jgi:hypothetical protein
MRVVFSEEADSGEAEEGVVVSPDPLDVILPELRRCFDDVVTLRRYDATEIRVELEGRHLGLIGFDRVGSETLMIVNSP